tara:strand:+ start:352 stop:711 length:360 start_codon:yes stop_codon:yes gene_type:complete
MTNDKLNKEFEEAINYINNKDLNLTISNSEKLNLYKFFKQATIGNINISKPSMLTLNQEPLLKYNAWKSVENITKEDAKKQYINLVNKYKEHTNTNTNTNSNIDLLNQLLKIDNNLLKR